jgi:hypothetical protein
VVKIIYLPVRNRLLRTPLFFYFLLATCKAQGINPHTWLAETLQQIGTYPVNRIEELLPGWKAEKIEAAG